MANHDHGIHTDPMGYISQDMGNIIPYSFISWKYRGWNTGLGWCLNASHHPTIGDESPTEICFGDVKQISVEGTLVGCFAPNKKDMWGGPLMGVPPNGWFIRENPTKIGGFRDAAMSSLVGFWLELFQCVPLLLGSPINPEIVLGKTFHVITVCIRFLFFFVCVCMSA